MRKFQWMKLAWVFGATFLGVMSLYSAHYADPELGISFDIGLLALSFPSGIIVQAIVPWLLVTFGVTHFSLFEGSVVILLTVVAGYNQWFVLIPYLKNKMR